MKFRKIVPKVLSMIGVASVLCNVGVSSASAAITIKDVVPSTEKMLKSFEGKENVDKEYIASALNLPEAYLCSESGGVQNFRLFDESKEQITLDENTLNWLYNQDAGKGSSSVMRILFPSSDGYVNVAGGYKYRLTKDVEPTPEFIAKIASICHRYRKDEAFKIQANQWLENVFYQSSIDRLKELKNEKENNEVDSLAELKGKLQLDEQKLIEKIETDTENFSKLEFNLQISKIKENLSKQKAAETLKKVNQCLPRFPHLKAILLREPKIDKRLLELVFANNVITEEKVKTTNKSGKEIEKLIEETKKVQLSKLQRVIDFCETVEANVELIRSEFHQIFPGVLSDEKEETLDDEGKKKAQKRSQTILHLVINMLYMIKNQEGDGMSTKSLPKYFTEKMLMAYFIKKFDSNHQEIERFYSEAADLIKSDSGTYGEEKIKELREISERFSVFHQKKWNPYTTQQLQAHSDTVQLKLKDRDSEGKRNCQFVDFGHPFNDCAETAIRHTLNLLLFSKAGDETIFEQMPLTDSEKQLIELIKAKITGRNEEEFPYLSLKERLKLFYHYQKRDVDQTSVEYKSFWNYVISSLIEGNQEEGMYPLLYGTVITNELRSDFRNVLKFIYNVEVVLQKELRLTPEQLATAKHSIDQLDLSTVEECIKNVYGLINKNLEIQINSSSIDSYDHERMLINWNATLRKEGAANSLTFLTGIGGGHSWVNIIKEDNDNAEREIKKILDKDSDEEYLSDLECNFYAKKINQLDSYFHHDGDPTFWNVYSSDKFDTKYCEEGTLKKYEALQYLHQNTRDGKVDDVFLLTYLYDYFTNHTENPCFGMFDVNSLKKSLKKRYEENAEVRALIDSYLPRFMDVEPARTEFKNLFGGKRNEHWVIPEGLFTGNQKITDFKPVGYKKIEFGKNAFQNSSVQTIEIPEGVEEIVLSENAFGGANTIKLPPTLECVILKEIPYNSALMSALKQCKIKHLVFETGTTLWLQSNQFKEFDIESIEISSKIGQCLLIQENAFNNCKNLKKIQIKSSDIRNLRDVSPKAFAGCDQLKTVELHSSVSSNDSVYRGIFVNAAIRYVD